MEPTAIVATVSVSSAISTNGNKDGEATVIASGGAGVYTYAWDAAAGNQITSVATGLAAGVYCVTVMDANGCSVNTCITLNNPTSGFSSTISSLVNASCNGVCDGTATASSSGGTGAVSFAWDAAAGNQVTPTATGLCAGIYCVTLSDAVGATSVNCVTILEPTAIVATVSVSSAISSSGNNDGEATVIASGGVGIYTYDWSTAAASQTTSVATGLAAGVYCVTVIDANGCAASTCITLNNPSSGLSATVTMVNPTCFGTCNGTATVSATGGSPTYSFAWDANAGNQLTSTATGLCAGTYCVTVTDGLAAITTSCVVLTSPLLLTATITDNGDETSTVVPAGGVPSYTYVWSHLGQVTPTASGLTGPTSVTVTDNNGCILIKNITISTCVWPGDTNDDGVANQHDFLSLGLHNTRTGTPRTGANISWTCQPSADWSTGLSPTYPTVDVKHADCNGDGIINVGTDQAAIHANWGATHLKSSTNNTSVGLDIYVDAQPATPGDTLSLPIILGEIVAPSQAYGVAFTINYDVSGVESNSVSIDFSNSWLGNISSNMGGIYKDFYSVGQVGVAMVRIDQSSAFGVGQIGNMNLIVDANVLGGQNLCQFSIYDF